MKCQFKYITLLIAALLFTHNVSAQRVIYNSQEVASGSKSGDVLDVQVLTSANHKLTIKKKGGVKEKFDYGTNKIWGYENRQHEIYRLYKEEFYLVKNITGPVFIYITRSPDLLKRGVVTKDNYFFSKSLDSVIHDFNKKELVKAYRDDKCLSGKIALLRQNTFIETTMRNAGTINTLYKECH